MVKSALNKRADALHKKECALFRAGDVFVCVTFQTKCYINQ